MNNEELSEIITKLNYCIAKIQEHETLLISDSPTNSYDLTEILELFNSLVNLGFTKENISIYLKNQFRLSEISDAINSTQTENRISSSLLPPGYVALQGNELDTLRDVYLDLYNELPYFDFLFGIVPIPKDEDFDYSAADLHVHGFYESKNLNVNVNLSSGDHWNFLIPSHDYHDTAILPSSILIYLNFQAKTLSLSYFTPDSVPAKSLNPVTVTHSMNATFSNLLSYPSEIRFFPFKLITDEITLTMNLLLKLDYLYAILENLEIAAKADLLSGTSFFETTGAAGMYALTKIEELAQATILLKPAEYVIPSITIETLPISTTSNISFVVTPDQYNAFASRTIQPFCSSWILPTISQDTNSNDSRSLTLGQMFPSNPQGLTNSAVYTPYSTTGRPAPYGRWPSIQAFLDIGGYWENGIYTMTFDQPIPDPITILRYDTGSTTPTLLVGYAYVTPSDTQFVSADPFSLTYAGFDAELMYVPPRVGEVISETSDTITYELIEDNHGGLVCRTTSYQGMFYRHSSAPFVVNQQIHLNSTFSVNIDISVPDILPTTNSFSTDCDITIGELNITSLTFDAGTFIGVGGRPFIGYRAAVQLSSGSWDAIATATFPVSRVDEVTPITYTRGSGYTPGVQVNYPDDFPNKMLGTPIAVDYPESTDWPQKAWQPGPALTTTQFPYTANQTPISVFQDIDYWGFMPNPGKSGFPWAMAVSSLRVSTTYSNQETFRGLFSNQTWTLYGRRSGAGSSNTPILAIRPPTSIGDNRSAGAMIRCTRFITSDPVLGTHQLTMPFPIPYTVMDHVDSPTDSRVLGFAHEYGRGPRVDLTAYQFAVTFGQFSGKTNVTVNKVTTTKYVSTDVRTAYRIAINFNYANSRRITINQAYSSNYQHQASGTINGRSSEINEARLPEGLGSLSLIDERFTQQANLLQMFKDLFGDVYDRIYILEDRVDFIDTQIDQIFDTIDKIIEAITPKESPLGMAGNILNIFGGMISCFLPIVGTAITIAGSVLSGVDSIMQGDLVNGIMNVTVGTIMGGYTAHKLNKKFKGTYSTYTVTGDPTLVEKIKSKYQGMFSAIKKPFHKTKAGSGSVTILNREVIGFTPSGTNQYTPQFQTVTHSAVNFNNVIATRFGQIKPAMFVTGREPQATLKFRADRNNFDLIVRSRDPSTKTIDEFSLIDHDLPALLFGAESNTMARIASLTNEELIKFIVALQFASSQQTSKYTTIEEEIIDFICDSSFQDTHAATGKSNSDMVAQVLALMPDPTTLLSDQVLLARMFEADDVHD